MGSESAAVVSFGNLRNRPFETPPTRTLSRGPWYTVQSRFCETPGMAPTKRSPSLILQFLVALVISATGLPPAGAQVTQQGPKLVGTGAVPAACQGYSVALSADGSTAIVGGPNDNGDAGAAWVYTRSGSVWNQQGDKLVGTDAVGSAKQGSSVSLSADGSTAIVGGPNDNVSVGAAWVYTRSGGTWNQQGIKLVGTGSVAGSYQGYSVALSSDGNTAIVGGTNHNLGVGAAWVYVRSGGLWNQQGGLVGTGAQGQGWSVALSADGSTAIMGNAGSGGALVYTRSGGVWSQQGDKLVGTGAVGSARQGSSVALSADGNTAIVGGSYDNGLLGAVWAYTRSGGVWTQQGAKLVGTGAVPTLGTGAGQGSSVALSADGNTAIVGGPNDNAGIGAAWVYVRSGGVWSQQGGKSVGTGATGGSRQGSSVALSADGNAAIMGGPNDSGTAGAAWTYTRIGGLWIQQGDKLVGTGAAGGIASQGSSVALSADGNTAIVGGPNDDGNTGAAWVYVRSGDAWNQQGDKLVAIGAVGSSFGSSVALSADGSTAIVGGSNDNGGIGAAWVYTRLGGMWRQQGDKLVGSGAIGEAGQGNSVALSADGNTAIIGGFYDNVGIGAVWVYSRSGGLWRQQGGKLVGTGAVRAALQGSSVALAADGNTALVGGPFDNSSIAIGAAWVYTRSGGVWSQQGGKLIGTGGGLGGSMLQGNSVALSADGNTAIVGGPDDNGFLGAVWAYTRSGGVWSQQGGKLVGTGGVGEATFQGWSVALAADGNTVIVGGVGDNSNAGATWVYTRSGGLWNQQGGKSVGTGAVGGAQQGYSVALSADGGTALVGGPFDDSNAGAAWVFVIPPVIVSIASSGVVNGASFLPGLAPGAWITINGANLSATTRSWTGSDFSGSTNLPTRLDGVSVTVNGKSAYVYFISPTQLNVLSPAETTQGSVPVQVTTAQGVSNVVSADESALSPALFTFSPQGGKYVAAVRADGVYVAPPNLISGLATVPAKPGDTVLLFGTGFGPTIPPSPIGQLINPAPLANPVTVRIGGVAAITQFAGIVSPGEYQFNVVVPNVSNGDNAVSIEIGGSTSQSNAFLTIQK